MKEFEHTVPKVGERGVHLVFRNTGTVVERKAFYNVFLHDEPLAHTDRTLVSDDELQLESEFLVHEAERKLQSCKWTQDDTAADLKWAKERHARAKKATAQARKELREAKNANK